MFSWARFRRHETPESAQPCGFERLMGRTHGPFAMQKVVGSSPIIRSSLRPRKGAFLRGVPRFHVVQEAQIGERIGEYAAAQRVACAVHTTASELAPGRGRS